MSYSSTNHLSLGRHLARAMVTTAVLCAVMYLPTSGETVVTQVTGVNADTPAAGLFEVPEGLTHVNGLSEVF